jgi:serine/threonine protein phosphatase PrpC
VAPGATFATLARPGSSSEDWVLASAETVVVLDGAGLPADLATGCQHGVRWYVQRLGLHLIAEAQRPDPLSDALAEAIRRTADEHRTTCDLEHPRSPSSTVVAARRRGDEVEWLVLGDSTALLVGGDGVVAISDRRLDDVAADRRAGLVREQPDRPAAAAELVDAERAARNSEGGYWIAAAEPTAAWHAIVGSASRHDIRQVVLATDGATRPVDQFGVKTWADLVETVDRAGPAAWLAVVRELESTDASGQRWPRSKAHDDATLAVLGVA